MLLSISKRALYGNPFLIFLISLVLVVSTYDDTQYTRSADLLILSQEEIDDLAGPHGIPVKADSFSDGCDLAGVWLASERPAAESLPKVPEDRSPVVSAPIYALLHAYRAPPVLY